MYRIAKADIPALLAAIAAKGELYLPVNTAGKTNFAPWSEDADVDLETLKTVRSGKDVFFPRAKISTPATAPTASCPSPQRSWKTRISLSSA